MLPPKLHVVKNLAIGTKSEPREIFNVVPGAKSFSL